MASKNNLTRLTDVTGPNWFVLTDILLANGDELNLILPNK